MRMEGHFGEGLLHARHAPEADFAVAQLEVVRVGLIMCAATRISFSLSCCAAPTTAPASMTVKRLPPGPVPLRP
jgi:hypothetical protein